MGSAYIETRNYAQAEDLLNSAIRVKDQSTMRWILPFAHFKLGTALAKQDKTAAANEQYAKALEYEDYPSESLLRLRVRPESSKLKRSK